MSSNIAIHVSNLSKCYHIYDTPRDRLKQFILPRVQRAMRLKTKQYYHDFWALKDVSFEIKKGETVGIIGRNGSGKSTLLQIICSTLTPTSGIVQTTGRIAALLELGAGFNPEFTGRENVFMSCALLGLTPEQTESCFDDIAAFADIGDFIEQPVKTYSSGMFVRLAFAVNIISEPEIMVIDEALAVGDMNFQAKCMSALTHIQKNGATVLFVSHDVGAIKSLCSKCVFLEQGEVHKIGNAPEVAELYLRIMREEMNREQHHFIDRPAVKDTGEAPENNQSNVKIAKEIFKTSNEFNKRVAAFRYGTGSAKITYAELLNNDGKQIDSVEFDQQVSIVIYFKTDIAIELSCNYYIADEKKNLVIGSGFRLTGQRLLRSKKNRRYKVTYKTRLPLHEGNYSIQLQLTQPVIVDQSAEFIDVIENAIVFNVSRKQNCRLWTQVFVPNTVQVLEV